MKRMHCTVGKSTTTNQLTPSPRLNFYRTQVSLGSDLWVLVSVRPSLTDVCKDLTDVTLADKDTNSILTDNANWAIQGNVAMWHKIVTNFGNNASGTSL